MVKMFPDIRKLDDSIFFYLTVVRRRIVFYNMRDMIDS